MKQDMFNGEAVGLRLTQIVKSFTANVLAKLTDRVATLEAHVAAMPAPEKGEQGLQGPPGPQGEKGEPGVDGKDGAPGPQGEKGDQGDTGKIGLTGKDGAPGVPGKDGRDGVDGNDGAQGPKGEKGEPGLNGKDGVDGINGKDGAPGPQGEKGEQGLPGKDGAAGLQGEKGLDGRDGRDGKDGAAGRDAFEIDILPSIVEDKSYPRGTLAQWGGGLIRATRNTDAWKAGDLLTDAGWTFLVRGVASVDVVKRSDERTFDIVFLYNDGEVERKSISVPTQIYRGIWKEGTYERGDTVTLGGCSWHCERETSHRPGTNDDWRMAVKKGTDGKDGKPGEKGERGATGRAGKDLTQLSFSGVKT